MKNKYTNNHIDSFFEQFKQLPDFFELDKVHQIINNPDAKARLSGTEFFKPLNLIFMTTSFIIGVIVLSIWLLPEKTSTGLNKRPVTSNFPEQQVTGSNSEFQNMQSTLNTSLPDTSKKINLINNENITTPVSSDKSDGAETVKRMSEGNKRETGIAINNRQNVSKATQTNCDWPKDTVLDKHKLIINLSKEELERIGYFVYSDTAFKNPLREAFKKRYKDGFKYVNRMNSLQKNIYYDIYNRYSSSDTTCTDHRWNDTFYDKIDTLVPVKIRSMLYWYVANNNFLDSLPLRYNYLKETYENLKCLKKQYPDNQFVNYWNKNVILGEVKYIELSRMELEKIGVFFGDDTISYRIINLATQKIYYNYQQISNKAKSTTYLPKDSIPPANLPILKTDEKGLRQYFFGLNKKEYNFRKPDPYF